MFGSSSVMLMWYYISMWYHFCNITTPHTHLYYERVYTSFDLQHQNGDHNSQSSPTKHKNEALSVEKLTVYSQGHRPVTVKMMSRLSWNKFRKVKVALSSQTRILQSRKGRQIWRTILVASAVSCRQKLANHHYTTNFSSCWPANGISEGESFHSQEDSQGCHYILTTCAPCTMTHAWQVDTTSTRMLRTCWHEIFLHGKIVFMPAAFSSDRRTAAPPVRILRFYGSSTSRWIPKDRRKLLRIY